MAEIINLFDFKKQQNAQESEEQYIYRICSMKETSGKTWQQIADIIENTLSQNSKMEVNIINRWKDVYQRNKPELDKLDADIKTLRHQNLSPEKEKKLKRRYTQIQALRHKMQWLEEFGESNLGIVDACSRSDQYKHEIELVKKAINKIME